MLRCRRSGRGVSELRLEAVGKRYGLRQPWIVRDVSAEIAAGRLIRLEGPNGSGKSTLLRLLAGVTMPSAGKVTGRPHAGYVPERFPGGLAFSAREYLRHLGRIHGLSGFEVTRAADDWLERLGATDYARAPLKTLSKGMCQKVAIAQALLARPGLLVLDEAWTGLDQAARGALDAAVDERLGEGATVLFVDHDPARLADRVDERWQLGGGAAVTMTTGPAGNGPAGGAGSLAGGARTAAGRAEPVALEQGAEGAGSQAAGPGSAPIAAIIEVTGLEAGSLARLGALSGVLGASADAAAADDPFLKLGPVQVTVAVEASDSVLRELLSWDGVHVATVRVSPVRASPGPGQDGHSTGSGRR